MEYISFITLDDVKTKGYDLTAPNRLNLGDFTTIEEAAEEFIKSCFDSIYELIEAHKGIEWTEKFFNDMSSEINAETYPRAYKLQKAIKKAILLQTIFLYENGDASDSAEKSENVSYSPKAMRILYSNEII